LTVFVPLNCSLAAAYKPLVALEASFILARVACIFERSNSINPAAETTAKALTVGDKNTATRI